VCGGEQGREAGKQVVAEITFRGIVLLTQVTVSGYKSLQESTARLAPFTVIVGRNNAGKSNLFDALRLLS
jgi:tRNA U34 5-carboxymethylaminomethyl modifying GTPase MnmE/TrmE